MTGPGATPNKQFPAGAANAAPGFAHYANTSQADYRNQITGGVINAFGPLLEICTQIEEVPIFLSLQIMGALGSGGPGGHGIVGDLIQGLQIVADFFCGLLTGTPVSTPTPPAGTTLPPSGTNVYSVMAGASSATNTAMNSPFLGGILGLGSTTGTGGLLEQLINGFEFFVNILCQLVTTGTNILGAGAGAVGATGTSPLSVINGVEQVVTAILGNPLISELISIGEAVLGTAENTALSLLTGLMEVANSFIGLFTGVIGGITGAGASLGISPLIGALGAGSPLGSVFAIVTDLFGLLGPVTGLGTGKPLPPQTLPGIPLMNATQVMFDAVANGLGGTPGAAGVSSTGIYGVAGATANTATSGLQTAAQVNAQLAAQTGLSNSNNSTGGIAVTFATTGAPGAVWV